MSTELAWIVPTRGRPDAVPRLDEAWTATGAWECADLVLVVDDDDPECEQYYDRARKTHTSVWAISSWKPMVHKLDWAAVGLAGGYGYTALGFGGDDHVPRTPGWARVYLDALAELGTGVVYGDDLYQGERLPTQWAMTADIVRELGRMVPAPVDHLYCDNAILELGQAAGCIRYVPDVVVEHMHPVAGKARSDEGYARVNARAQYRKDHSAFEQWRWLQLGEDAAKIRALRGGVETCRT